MVSESNYSYLLKRMQRENGSNQLDDIVVE